MAKDVLEVLDIAGRSLIGAGASEFREDFTEARARIAELIAADVEYDETVEEINRPGEISADAWRRAHRAEERRAAALAACRGMA